MDEKKCGNCIYFKKNKEIGLKIYGSCQAELSNCFVIFLGINEKYARTVHSGLDAMECKLYLKKEDK